MNNSSTPPGNLSFIGQLIALDSVQLEYWLERLLADTPVNPLPPVKGEIVDILRYVHHKAVVDIDFQREFRRQIFRYFVKLVNTLPTRESVNSSNISKYHYHIESIDNLIHTFNTISEFVNYQSQIAVILVRPDMPLLGHKSGPYRDLHLALLSIYIDFTDGALDESIKIEIDNSPAEQLIRSYLIDLIPKFRNGSYYELALRYFTWHLGIDFKPYFAFVDKSINYITPGYTKSLSIDDKLLHEAVKYLLNSRGTIIWPYLFDWLFDNRPQNNDVEDDQIINRRITIQHIVIQLLNNWNSIFNKNIKASKEDQMYSLLNLMLFYLHLPTEEVTYELLQDLIIKLADQEKEIVSFDDNKPLKLRYIEGIRALTGSIKFNELIEFGSLDDFLIISPKKEYLNPEDEFAFSSLDIDEIASEIDYKCAPILVEYLYREGRFIKV